MNIVQFNYFRETVLCGSFSGAAQKLGVTQPAISTQIKKLENTFGAKLLFKRNGRLHLTDCGRTVLQHAIKIIDQVNVLQEDVKILNNPDKISGNVSLGCGPLLSKHILPALITGFLKQYPDVNLTIIEADSSELSDLMDRNKIDIGIGVNSLKKNKHLIYKKLFDDEFVCIKKQDRNAKKEKAISLQQLHDFPFINNTPGSIIHSVLMKHLDAEKLQTILYTRNSETAIEFVKEGLGIYLIPNCLVNILKPQNIQVLKLDKAINLQVGLYLKPTKIRTAAQNAMIKLFEDQSYF